MKKILFGFLVAICTFGILSGTYAYTSVQGYFKSNGTYVAPHVRSSPNGLKFDNYSYTPSQGLYHKSYGTKGLYWDTPTYITDLDYYIGKSIYETNNNSSYPNYSNTVTLPTTPVAPIVKIQPKQTTIFDLDIKCKSQFGTNSSYYSEKEKSCMYCTGGKYVNSFNGTCYCPSGTTLDTKLNACLANTQTPSATQVVAPSAEQAFCELTYGNYSYYLGQKLGTRPMCGCLSGYDFGLGMQCVKR